MNKNNNLSAILNSLEEILKSHYIINTKFKDNWFNFIWQSGAVGLITGIIIFTFSRLDLVILVGTASTFFTIFTIPTNRTARIRNIIGSYIIILIIGMLCFYISPTTAGKGIAIVQSNLPFSIIIALAEFRILHKYISPQKYFLNEVYPCFIYKKQASTLQMTFHELQVHSLFFFYIFY